MLLLGTVCERKGQHDLVRAFATLPAPVARRMKCVVLGARDTLAYSRELRRLASLLAGDRRDRFMIIPETGETAPYWLAADIFCCTSRVESYPHVTLEAMAAGLPLITTPVFGIAEQVRPSYNALTYQPGDIRTLTRHLTLLARDEDKRRSFAKNSRSTLRSLPDHVHMDEQYRRVFRAAAESAPLVEPESHETSAGRDNGRSLAWSVHAAQFPVASPKNATRSASIRESPKTGR